MKAKFPFRLAQMGLAQALLLLAGCPSAGTGGGGPTSTAPAVSGGPVAASCPTEGAIGCAPGATQKVRCKGGVWVDDGACSDGTTCKETKTGTTVTATLCGYPAPIDVSRATACAKLAACVENAMTLQNCVDGGQDLAVMQSFLTKVGGIWEIDDISGPLLPIGCMAGAKDCAGVAACINGSMGACAANEPDGCNGSVGWECRDSLRLSADCAKFGLTCNAVTGKAVCLKPATQCQPGMTGVTCSGDDAQVCASAKGKSVGFTFHCAAAGMTCGPQSKVDDDLDACQPKQLIECDDETFVDRCEGSTLVRCKSGYELEQDCTLFGRVCGLVDWGSGPESTCKRPGDDCNDDATCQGDRLVFCGGGKKRELDCASLGTKCGTGADGFEKTCLFP